MDTSKIRQGWEQGKPVDVGLLLETIDRGICGVIERGICGVRPCLLFSKQFIDPLQVFLF